MATSANKPEYELIKNAMSKKKSNVSPGVLVLNNSFPFHFNKYNRKKDTAYYLENDGKNFHAKYAVSSSKDG